MRCGTSILIAMLVTSAATASAQCVGDCDASYTVSVDEVVSGVNIFFDLAELSTCPSLDVDGSGRLAVNELVVAVGNLLSDSCIPISDSDRIFGNADSDTTVRIPIRAAITIGTIQLEFEFSNDFLDAISGCQFEQVFAFDFTVGSSSSSTYQVDVVAQGGTVTVADGDALVCSFHVSPSALGTLSLRLSGTIFLADGQTVPISGSGSGEIFSDFSLGPPVADRPGREPPADHMALAARSHSR